MNTIDQTQAQLNTHEQVCAFRYESICARLKRLENHRYVCGRHNHSAAGRHTAQGWRMSIILGQRSLSRLEGVHPDLVRVVKKAASVLSDLDFTVLEGLRTVERQKQLVAQPARRRR